MKKSKIFLGISLAICVLLMSVLCFFGTQRWTGSVEVADKDVAMFSSLHSIQKSEAPQFNALFFACSAGKESAYSSANDREKTYETAVFQRTMSLETEENNSKIVLSYSFPDAPYALCTVCISTDSAAEGTYSSIRDLQEALAEEITVNQRMYYRHATQGTAENVKYFISPLTTPSREACFYLFANDKNDRVIDSVYEIGEYFVSIHEYLPPNSQSKYEIVLQDVGNLCTNALQQPV